MTKSGRVVAATNEVGRMDDAKLRAAVSDLIEHRALDSGAPAYTVAQKIVFSGYASLTKAQKVLYEAVIVAALEGPGVKQPRS